MITKSKRLERLEKKVFILEGQVSRLQTELGYAEAGSVLNPYKHPPFATVCEKINLLFKHLKLDIVRVNAYKKVIPLKKTEEANK